MSWGSLKQYMMSTVLEDSAHYVLFAFNFYGYKPTTIVGMVPTLYCIMQGSSFIINMLQVLHGPGSSGYRINATGTGYMVQGSWYML